MMNTNLIRLNFLFNAIFISLGGLLINNFESNLPSFVLDIFYYGKFSSTTGRCKITFIHVPKRWYKHFYVFSTILFLFQFGLFIYVYKLNGNAPEFILWGLDNLLGSSRTVKISPECSVLISFLCTFHSAKRLYETYCVNVFSNQSMNIFHYLVGMMHYFGVFISIMENSYGFVRGTHGTLNWSKISIYYYLLAIALIWTSIEQLRCNFILRNLRKDKTGRVINTGYKIPTGRLFNYISSPLQFTEIIIYIILSLIIYSECTFNYITFWVVANQMECAIMNHQWFKKNFINYPKNRKIIIPYLL